MAKAEFPIKVQIGDGELHEIGIIQMSTEVDANGVISQEAVADLLEAMAMEIRMLILKDELEF
jgi:hypothetical protein